MAHKTRNPLQSNSDFIMAWDRYMVLGAYVCVGIAFMVLIYHEVRILLIRDYKEKYDYVNLNEIRFFWYAVIALITGAALYANSIGTEMVFSDVTIWFYVRLFITGSFA